MHELTFEGGWNWDRQTQFRSCLVRGFLVNIKPSWPHSPATQTRKVPENETNVTEDSSRFKRGRNVALERGMVRWVGQ